MIRISFSFCRLWKINPQPLEIQEDYPISPRGIWQRAPENLLWGTTESSISALSRQASLLCGIRSCSQETPQPFLALNYWLPFSILSFGQPWVTHWSREHLASCSPGCWCWLVLCAWLQVSNFQGPSWMPGLRERWCCSLCYHVSPSKPERPVLVFPVPFRTKKTVVQRGYKTHWGSDSKSAARLPQEPDLHGRGKGSIILTKLCLVI